MSEQDDDEARARHAPSHDEHIDADRVVSPDWDHLLPKFEMPEHLLPKFEMPEHLLPKFEMPEHLLPKFEMPEHLLPKFEMPEHLLPKFEMPEHLLPKFEMPEHLLPKFEMPEHLLPKFEMPEHLLPKFEMPEHLLPKFEMPEHLLPKFEMPEHLLPKFEMPEHLLPKFEMPEHLLPKFEMPDRFTGWLDSAVPRIDMAALSNVVRTAFAVNHMHDTLGAAARTVLDIDRAYRDLDDLLSPALSNVFSTIDEITRLAPAVQSAAQVWTAQVNDLMQGWTALSRFGHRLANKALHLALATRDAVVNNPDRKAVRDAVIDFMRRALGYKSPPTEARIEAVVSALLDDTWLPRGDTGLDYNPSKPIRKIVASEHALWLPMSETRPLGGRRMASLEKPDQVALGGDEGNPTCPMDRLQSADFTPEQQPIKHPVLKRIMDPLNAIEQEIVWTRLYDGARTWADAATMCGRPPQRRRNGAP